MIEGSKTPLKFYQSLNPFAPGGAFWIISINGIVYANKISASVITIHIGQYSNTFGGFSFGLAVSATGNACSPLGAKNAKLMKMMSITIIPKKRIEPPIA